MSSGLFYPADFWVTSFSMPDAAYWESVFPCEEDFQPALKKQRLEHEDDTSNKTISFWSMHEPQYCELQCPFTPLLQPQQDDSVKTHSNEIKDKMNDLKKVGEQQQDPSPTWEDFFQYMVSQDSGLVAETDNFTSPIAEPVNFTAPIAEPVNLTIPTVASPKPRLGHRRRAPSNMVVQGNEVRYSCTMCTQTFPTNRGFKIHLHTHKMNTTSPTNSKMNPPRYRALKGNLQHHLGHNHFSCPLCGREFRIRQALLIHMSMKVCTRADRFLRRVTRGWECTSCDKVYSNRDQAVHHTQSHDFEGGLSCPVCHEDFTGYRGNVLLKHIKNTHQEYFDDLGC